MLVGKTIQDLRDNIYVVLEEYNVNKEIMNDAVNSLMKKNIYEARRILNGSVPLETLEVEILYLIASELYYITKKEIVNPTKYFTELELKDLDKFMIPEKQNLASFPLVFENVEQLNEKQWTTKIPIKTVVSLYNSHRITYNFETQRNPKYIERGKSIIKKPNVNWDSVNQIAELMLKNLFFSNYITFNVRANGEEDLAYDKKNKRLIIRAGETDALDGFHRSLAMLKAYHENNQINYNSGLIITNFDVSTANAFIRQEDKRNKIEDRHLKYTNELNYANDIVRALNTATKSDLRGKISTDISLVNRHLAYTLTDIMSESIEKLYIIKTREDKDNIEQYLMNFFNKIYAIFYDDFSKLRMSRKENMIAHQNAFIFYICLSKLLQNDEDYKNNLVQILSKIDFNNTNPDWKKLKLAGRHKITNKMIENITTYIKNKIS